MVANQIELEDLGDYEMDQETSEKVERMIATAEEELESVKLNFSWGQKQIDIILRAAQLTGVPYPTFIKLAAYQQALSLLTNAELVEKNKSVA